MNGKIIFFLLFLFFVIPQSSLAFGASPAIIEVFNIRPENRIEKYITISRSNPKQDDPIVIVPSGKGSKALFFPKDGLITLPKGEEQTRIPFSIQPAHLAPGEYEAAVAIQPQDETASPEAKTQGVVIRSGVQVMVRFSVTHSIIELFEINQARVSPVQELSPFPLSFTMVNTGNIENQLSKILVTVNAEDSQSNGLSTTISEPPFPIIPPFSENNITVSVPLSLSPGQYKLSAQFMLTNGMSQSRDVSRFQVASRAPAQSNSDSLLSVLLAIVILAGLASAIIVFLFKKRKR